MNSITLSPRFITALRTVRIAAWLAVAFCLGTHFAAPAPENFQLQAAHPVSHMIGASSCGCADHEGTIS
ncbi:hypothetical protein MNQ96_02830 [Sphingopyxis granuli]|uniref:hypothetical protein n=1 Tax=Sphingopyxis granuli TaxID=267128 RepID=UPI001F52F473|nr:hypothetical protein [Sphingopyxis granuli]UNK80049.1 hypothetical protein MNQ96_02830 [Sphingopyxis granuli]